ncbi:MAG TPA: carboxypeptidase regulatory-like domain-containing protein, partial [Planctomycetota bacterium]|nr:carboxypeptidase regulatory-like domain-containing protein [Planctomycetota bacterium]
PPGTHYVFAQVEGAPAAMGGPVAVRPGERAAPVTIEVTLGVVMRGKVVDDRGRPVAGALVTTRAPRPPEEPRDAPEPPHRPLAAPAAAPGRAETAEDGTFEIRVARGTWRFVVEHPDLLPYVGDPIPCFADGPTGELRVARGGALTGKILAADGAPDAAATVSASSEAGEMLIAASAETDAQGTFVLRGLRPGKWYVRVVRREGAFSAADEAKPPVAIVVAAGELRKVDL